MRLAIYDDDDRVVWSEAISEVCAPARQPFQQAFLPLLIGMAFTMVIVALVVHFPSVFQPGSCAVKPPLVIW